MYSTNFDYEEKLILKLQSSFSSFLPEILIIRPVKFEVANPLCIFHLLFPNKNYPSSGLRTVLCNRLHITVTGL